MTLVTNLVDKQAAMQARSQKKRRKQQRLNALGPRKKETIARPQRRSYDSIIKGLLLRATERYACFLLYVRDRYARNEPVATFQEFYKYKDGEGPSDNPFIRDFQIQDPTVQNPLESIPA